MSDADNAQTDLVAVSAARGKTVTGVARGAYTIEEFCEAHRISLSKYYELKQSGLNPDEMQIDRRVIITVEAAARWRRKRTLMTEAAARKKAARRAAVGK